MLKVGSEVTVKIVNFPFMETVKGVVIDTNPDGKYGWLEEPSGELYWVGETQAIR